MDSKSKEELTGILCQLVECIENGNGNTLNIANRLYASINLFIYGDNLNKYNACRYVGLSRSRFDDYVRLGMIPQGIPESGSHELRWREADLDAFLKAKYKQLPTNANRYKSAR
jgi:predicted DNA-binding transcriptional regulator AlpA